MTYICENGTISIESQGVISYQPIFYARCLIVKKSRKILIICLIIVAVVAGGAAYTFRPLTFSQAIGGVKADEIEKITICNGEDARPMETVEITDKSEIEEIYGKIGSIRLKAVPSEQVDGCGYDISVYVKGADGYITYEYGKNFYKRDGYKKGVGDFLWYKDSSSSMRNVLLEYFNRHYTGGITE